MQNTQGERPRLRVSLACTSCRTKRIKCGGEQPVCNICASRGLECVYTHRNSKRKPPGRRYVDALQTRIKSLEEQLRSLGHEPDDITANQADPLDDIIQAGGTPHGGESFDSSESGDAEVDPSDILTETTGRLNIGEDGELHYYGSLSNFHLLRGNMRKQTSLSSRQVREAASSAVDQLNFDVSITEELRDHLLDLFWRWQNTWQYIVHKGAFLTEMKDGKQGQYCTPLVYCAILALASRYSDRPEIRVDPSDPNTAGDRFAQKAKLLLFYEIEAPTTSTVQAATLVALREYAANREASAWVYMGIATRIAHNLGLHLNSQRSSQRSQVSALEQEVRRVTWWGCYLVDKLSNIGLGRPSSIQAQDVKVPRPTILPEIEYEIWSVDSAGGLPTYSRMISNSHYAVELFQIISPPLDALYAPNARLNHKDKERLVIRVDVALRAFYNRLPSFLRLPSSTKTAPLPHVCSLHLQYHVAVIAFHRPFVQRASHDRKAREAAEQADANKVDHLDICRSSAIAIASILRTYQMHYSLRTIVISAVHCTFTASIIHLYDLTNPDATIRGPALRNLVVCAYGLRDMSTPWLWSARALEALGLLVTEWTKHLRSDHPARDDLTSARRTVEDAVRTLPEALQLQSPREWSPLVQSARPTSVAISTPEPIHEGQATDPLIAAEQEQVMADAWESCFWSSAFNMFEDANAGNGFYGLFDQVNE